MDISTQSCLWRNVNEIIDHTLVVNSHTCIEDTVLTNLRTTLDYSALHNNGSIANRCVRRDYRRRMNNFSKVALKFLDYLFTNQVVSNTNDNGRLAAPVMPNRNRHQFINCIIIIKHAVYLDSRRIYDVDDDFCVPACSVKIHYLFPLNASIVA